MPMRKDVKREYKRDVKRMMIFLLIMLPFLAVITFCFDYFLHMDRVLNIFLLVVIGGFGVLIMELIYKKIQDKKAEKPKKKDPYAD